MQNINDIAEFIQNLPDKRKTDLSKLRKIIREIYPDIIEIVKNNILDFQLNNVSMFVFGSQKQRSI